MTNGSIKSSFIKDQLRILELVFPGIDNSKTVFQKQQFEINSKKKNNSYL